MSGLMNVRGVVVSLINKFISPYVDNLNPDDLNLAVMAGDLTLHNLHLKRSAVEKYGLPVDVLEGHVGHLHITVPWFSFRTNPIVITVEDVFLLVRMKQQGVGSFDPREEEKRLQEAKQERLRNAESLDLAAQASKNAAQGTSDEEKETWLGAFTSKLIDNVQISVKNIHLRYEDDLSTPEHPFAAGFTLASFKAVSTNEDWVEAFIQNSIDGVRKLASLDGLSIYFDTDAKSIYKPPEKRREMLASFTKQIASKGKVIPHQYILKPVSGEARTILRKKHSKEKPKTDAQVFFDEIGFVLDDDQYRDALSMLDLFHFYTRTRQYKRFRPPDLEFEENRPKALWKFATTAIRSEIHEKHRKWSWDYFQERREARKSYIDLYVKKLPGHSPMSPEDQAVFDKLELELSYEDIRFFRSIARNQAKKDAEMKRKLDEETKKKATQANSGGGWFGWVWGSSAKSSDPLADGEPIITEDDRKQLNEIIDFDASASSIDIDIPRDFRLLHVEATLNKGSLALRRNSQAGSKDIIALEFQTLAADVSQYPETLDAAVTLGSFSVFDGTAPNSLYPQIVRVKQDKAGISEDDAAENPFFFARFERNPLDKRADTGLTLKMRHLEIFYHRGYIEEVVAFFRPPASQLESINALLDAAGETLEGLRQETRAGLAYALEQHKTVDMQVDMNAPIIIVPQDVTNSQSTYFILDAGHIAINSNLASKERLREIQSSHDHSQSDESIRELEELMYDKFSVRLEDAQILLGQDFNSCIAALEIHEHHLHIVERISMAFTVQTSILNLPQLTRFKISGDLPILTLNASDKKYQSLMRIIDIAIPRYGAGNQEDGESAPTTSSGPSNAFRRERLTEYVLNDEESVAEADDQQTREDSMDDSGPDKFYEAHDSTAEAERQDLTRKNFEFRFGVQKLQANLSKADRDGKERLLATAMLAGFDLNFTQRKFDMAVHLVLRALTVATNSADGRSQPVITSEELTESGSEDLVVVDYLRVQKTSPEFLSVHEGIDQAIEAKVSTINIFAEPEPVLALYDFIMTTFVPQTPAPSDEEKAHENAVTSDNPQPQQSDKIRIRVKLRSINLSLQDRFKTFVTLTLSAGQVALLLRAGTMRLGATIGNLTLIDDECPGNRFKDVLSIEGKELADFTYETFDVNDKETFPGYNSLLKLRSGSLKFTFSEEPIRRIRRFLTKMAQLKAVYDAASQAALQRAAEVTRMRFDIVISSPIVILPADGASSEEAFYARLGEISASNDYLDQGDDESRLRASVKGVAISTRRLSAGKEASLPVLKDTDVFLEIQQRTPAAVERGLPATNITGSTNVFELGLTERQYMMLMQVFRTIPRAMQSIDENTGLAITTDERRAIQTTSMRQDAVESEGGSPDHNPTPSTTTFSFEVPGVTLELFDRQATERKSLEEHSIARFQLSSVKASYKSQKDGSSEAKVALKTFAILSTRASSAVYRDLVQESGEDKEHFSLVYTSTGGSDPISQALLQIDSPRIVLSADPLSALLQYLASPFRGERAAQSEHPASTQAQTQEVTPPGRGSFSYRVELRQAIALVLADDSDFASPMIQLNLHNAVLAQQAKMTLVLHGLGLSFGKMDEREDTVSFLDELDITVALDSEKTGTETETSVDIMVQPIILRASLNDVLLVTDIVNKASAVASSAFNEDNAVTDVTDAKADKLSANTGRNPKSSKTRNLSSGSNRTGSSGTKVTTSREVLRATFDGLQLVLVGDLHQLPLIHFATQPFDFQLNDWSANMSMQTSISSSINYYNLKNSHWEPLMDPWEFGIRVGKLGASSGGALAVNFISKRRLELNASAAFIELAITSMTVWSKEGERLRKQGRGDDAPFLVRNRTGYPILLWSDSSRPPKGKSVEVKRVADGSAIPWRFQDYKKLRENLSSFSHNAFGLQLDGTAWERVRNISVDRQGEHPYVLKPRMQKIAHRLICDVELKDNVKIVTFRSSFRVENLTHLPMELVMIDENGKAASSVQHIPPGDDYPLPIEASFNRRLRLRPTRGFNYSWSGESYSWQDFVRRPIRAVVCKNKTPEEAAFRFQAASIYDKADPSAKSYPRLTVRLRAPVEVENLLPYNIRYRVYDKNTRSNTTSFLIRGGCSPIHTVDLDHLLLLSVDAQDSGFKPSEFAIINTDNPDDFRTEDTLVMHDKKNVKLELKLHYFTYPDSGGAFKVQIYSPLVVLNKTKLPLSLAMKTWSGQKPVAGLETIKSGNPSEPKPLMMCFPGDERKDRLLLRLGDSDWSRPVSVETLGADQEVKMACRLEAGSEEMSRATMHVGLSYAEGLGKYKLSKIVTISPRFLVRNDCAFPLKLRQYRTHVTASLDSGVRIPWYTFTANAPPQFVIAMDGISSPWSAPFNTSDVGRIHTLVHDPSSGNGAKKLVKVDTRLDGSTIFLYLSEETSGWPLKLRNRSSFKFKFCQTEDKSSTAIAQDRKMLALEPGCDVGYTWDSPAATNKRIRLQVGDFERSIDIMEIGIQPPFKFKRQVGGHAHAVSLDVRAEGSSQVLVIADYNEQESVYKPKKTAAALTRQDSVDSFNAMSFETVAAKETPNLSIHINFEGLGISVVNRNLQELVYLSFRGIKLSYEDFPQYYDVNLDCKWIQIDNQLFGGLYPIILYPTTIPKDGKELESHPTLQSSIAILKDDQHGVTYVKYASILLQAMTIELDEDFLFAFLEFSKFEDASWQEPTPDVLIQAPGEIADPKEIPPGANVYFEILAFQPLQLELSFMRTDRVNVDNKVSTRNPVSFFVNAITMALGNVNAAPVQLNALIIHNARLTIPGLQERVTYHYREQFLAQIYRILGSADFLGNPVGLFNNVSSGFQDIFYEPYQGMVMHGNKELGIGIARGATSFAKKTIFGVTDSMTKVTSSIGKGLSAATMDSDYQTKRRMAARRNRPRHALYGFANGANAFATSVASGFEGLALKPIEGAESGGVGGFLKGVGKGVIGAVTKPVVGVVDFASNSFEGIRNTTTVFDQQDIDRVRLPRFIAEDGILRPFNEREALGQSWLKDLESGRYFSEHYVAHLDLTGDDSVLMLTTTRILLIRSTKLRVVWEVPFEELQTISLEPNGIGLVLRGDVGGPFVPVVEASERGFLFKHIEAVVKKHNEAKKVAET